VSATESSFVSGRLSRLLVRLGLVILSLWFPAALPALSEAEGRSQREPILTVDEDCVAFAFAPDGRIAYAVRRIISVRKVQMQRDDIWVTSLQGKKKRIVDGEKLIEGNAPFSYAIQSLRWSPDGRRLTVEMLTSQFEDQRGNRREGMLTLLIDENGKEIKIRGADSVIPEGSNAGWLGDGVTVAYLSEAVTPRLLFGVHTVRPVAGRGSRIFLDHAFVAVAWNLKEGTAVAVERDLQLQEPPRLVWLDFERQARRELAVLEGYLGNLILSPSGKKVAYYTGNETIEVRSLDQPEEVTQVRATFGTFLWGPQENRLLLKRGTSKRSASLMWIEIATSEVQPILRSLTYNDFDISPDGKYLAVTLPGKRILQVFPLP